MLAAFLAQTQDVAQIIAHGRIDERRDASEAVEHDADQGAVAQTDHRLGVDRGEQGAGLVGGERPGLSFAHDDFGAADGGGAGIGGADVGGEEF